jgi:predicted dehydrogenase
MLRVGIVGCGLIGKKRAQALGQDRLVAVCDREGARAAALAASSGARVFPTHEDLVRDPGVDAVIVATTNDQLAPVGRAALGEGKHVLLEKPGSRSAAEIEPLLALAEKARVVAKVGFNHRFHPAALKAREILEGGDTGPVLFVRARYGHGGRLGYEREWRADPAIAGGGELIDQGVHLIDLARWFLREEITEVSGRIGTFFWKMPVEDNAFLTLATARGQVAHLHASCTEWKNTFSFEIYAEKAKLHLEGLGGSYGTERLYHYRMLPQMGPPETTIHEYPQADGSWALEWVDFRESIEAGRTPSGTLADARAVLRVVDRVYEANRCRS